MEIFEELQERGLIAQVTDEKEIRDLILFFLQKSLIMILVFLLIS